MAPRKPPAKPDGSNLQALTQLARANQQLRPKDTSADSSVDPSTESSNDTSVDPSGATRTATSSDTGGDTQPVTSNGTRSKPRNTPRPTARTAAPAEVQPTASALAREAAGLPPTGRGTGLTAAERQARRRREKAQLVVELSPDQKAELLRDATTNGRTLRAEVLARLFGN